jgi:hypothetical protein
MINPKCNHLGREIRFFDHLSPGRKQSARRPALEKTFNASILDNRQKRASQVVRFIKKYRYSPHAVIASSGMHFTHVCRIFIKTKEPVNNIQAIKKNRLRFFQQSVYA